MPSKQERKNGPANGQEDETAPDQEQAGASTASAEEVSSKAAAKVEAIDEVLDEFDDLTLAELGFSKEDNVDSAKVDEAIEKKVKGFVQKGGQ
ncbi:hypothetical protein [Streptomyces sp. NPDC056632]|uniref:hypothetical protein n=1 Tax=Streptomyces sp. NPDC056632 TaxID=3345884 RepID=UPI0036C02F20